MLESQLRKIKAEIATKMAGLEPDTFLYNEALAQIALVDLMLKNIQE